MKSKKQLIELFVELNKNLNSGNAKFRYGILKNLKIINNEIESLKTIEQEITETLSEYNEKRNAIIIKYGSQKNGQISISPEDENFELAIKELEELNTESKELLDLHEEKSKEYNDLLEEECEFDFKLFEISIDNIPDEVKNLKVLMDFDIVK